MTLVYIGRIDKLEIGVDALNNTDITNLVLFNWERIHDVRPRLTANTKIPVGYQQPHSWIMGTFSLLSDNHNALYVRDVVAGGGVEPALDSDGDSNPIGFFAVTYRDADNNQRVTTFNTAIVTRGIKELLNYDDSVWIYHFMAYFADDAESFPSLMSADLNDITIFIHTGITSTITTSFSAPDNIPQGLTLDNSGNLVTAGKQDQTIYIHQGVTSTVTTSFSTPANSPTDLTMDNSGNLISSDDGSNSVYIHQGVTSTITTSFSSPGTDPNGMTLDLSGNLISSDNNSDSIYIHQGITSTVTTSFSAPNNFPTGLSLDNDGNLISSDALSDSIYIHTGITSTITTSFSAPDGAPWGLTYG